MATARDRARAKLARAKIAEIYANLPTVPCTGACHDSCGLIVASRREVNRMEAVSGRPFLCLGPDLTCGYLDPDKRCAIYAHRPLICRLYGVAEGLQCDFGCVPSRLLTRAEAGALILRVQALGGPAIAAELIDES